METHISESRCGAPGLDPRVVEWLKSKSEAYPLRINDILMNVMEAELAAGSR